MSEVRVVGLLRDLFFRSKIDAVAHSLGAEVVYASTLEIARNRCSELTPSLIFVDLSDANFPPLQTAADLRSAAPDAKLVGFASHVDLNPLAAAREAGFAHTLSRQEFTASLPELLKPRH